MKSPKEIVSMMMEKDEFSIWMGVKIISVDLGSCEIQTVVKPEMLNGFKILHGGISYSLADSALAFSSNSYGNKCVSIETSISHIRPAKEGDILTARSIEMHRGKSIAIYEITVTNQENKTIGLFKGTVHISQEIW